ncbi:MAG: M14 family metallopeptidase [Bacteroidales bacterium]|nr:M14 family metallopeptidase [Bacteroidales bacterium]
MQRFAILAAVALMTACTSHPPDWQTHYEKSGFTATPRYDETMRYCRQLDEASPWIRFTTFGQSPRQRDLPLMIIDRQGYTEPGRIRSAGRQVALVQCCIHPGESEGKDAMLMMMREMTITKQLGDLLEHVSLLVIPIFNVDGHERYGPYSRINQNGPVEMGWRTTAQNLNLNRDYMKADAPEMQAWLQLFHLWMPDFFIDCHTTDGADYQYVLTYAMEIFGNMDTALTRWQKEMFIPAITGGMERAGFPVFQYVSFRRWHDPRSGLYTGVSPAMLSQGYTALNNRPGLLIETHMLKPYQQRVDATYEMIRLSLQYLNQHHDTLRQMISHADQYCSGVEFRKDSVPVNFIIDYSDSIMVDFKGVAYDVIPSDLTGGDWFVYSDTPMTFRLPWFCHSRITRSVMLPEGYIIPVEWSEVIRRLDWHGIRYHRLDTTLTLTVSTYRFSDYQWSRQPFEGRHTLTGLKTEEITLEKEFPAGSVVIDMNQPAARVIAWLMEPGSDDSFVHWGFFDAIFEQKEYSETYVMEKVAREMLAENPELREEFDRLRKENPVFASQQWLQLNWFYQRTPWWDEVKDIYPVGRIMDREILGSL